MTALAGYGSNESGELIAGYRGAHAITPVASVLAPADVTKVDVSYHFSGELGADQLLRLNGGNQQGEIGNGHNVDVYAPFQVPLAGPCATFALGGAHAIALLYDGRVECWGEDAGGQMGNGHVGEHGEGWGTTSPVFASISGVSDVAAGGDCCGAIVDGVPFMWGGNETGQLGDGTGKVSPVPLRVAGLPSPAVQIEIGGLSDHGALVVVRCADGSAWGWGASNNNQLGVIQKVVAKPVPLPVGSNVVDIAVARSHVLLLQSTGHVQVLGLSTDGEAGVQAVAGVTGIAAGWRSSAVIVNGVVYTSGELIGREGPGTVAAPIPHVTSAKQVALGEFHSLILMDEQIPSASFKVTQAIGGCALEWSMPGDTEQVAIQWRPVVKPKPAPWSLPPLRRPATDCHAVIEGMPPGVPCEARVEGKVFKTHIGRVTPL